MSVLEIENIDKHPKEREFGIQIKSEDAQAMSQTAAKIK